MIATTAALSHKNCSFNRCQRWPHTWAAPTGGKSSRRAIEAGDHVEGHGPASQVVPHMAPKPIDPAASVATNRSGLRRDGLHAEKTNSIPGREELTPPGQIATKFEIEANRVGCKLVMRRKNDHPGGIISHTCWRERMSDSNSFWVHHRFAAHAWSRSIVAANLWGGRRATWGPFTLRSIQVGSIWDRSQFALRKCSHSFRSILDRSQFAFECSFERSQIALDLDRSQIDLTH